MKKKISAKEYIYDSALLECRNYIPYTEKVKIVDSVIKQVCVAINGTYTLDSVLLDRVKSQIFIEQCTNLDLSIVDDNLDGYDTLKKDKQVFNDLMKHIFDEISELDRILELRIADFIRDKASVKGILSYKLEKVIDYINVGIPSIVDKIEHIDVKTMINNLSSVLDKFTKQKK